MPVNIATGSTSLEFYDIELPGRVPLRWTARYCSDIVDRTASPIGRGWFGLAFSTLQRVDGGYVHTTANGTHVRFDDPGDAVAGGGTVRNLGAYLELFRDSDRNRFIVRSWDVETGEICHLCFDISENAANDWSLSAVEDISGDGVALVWSPSVGGPRLTAMRQRIEQRELRFGYDRAGLISHIDLQSSQGESYRLASYKHDAAGHLVSIADAADFADRFEYDVKGRVTREIVKDGGVFNYRYDNQGRCVLHTGLGHYNERRLRYLQAIGVTEVTDSTGNTTTYKHLSTGQRVLEIDPLGGQRTIGYDAHGRMVAKTDANGATTRYGFDEMGNRNLIVDALNYATTIRFDRHHLPVEFVAPTGRLWRQSYDDSGRLVNVQDPLGGYWIYSYDQAGNLASVRNPLGAERRLHHELGQLCSLTDWSGHATTFVFDAFGRLSERRGPLGETTRFRYDAVGNAVQAQLPDGSSITAAYDHGGNLTRYVDAHGHTTRWRYGPCARLLERTDPVGGTLRYVWATERERLEQIINEKGEVYLFEHDAAGRTVAETSFDGAKREYRLDAEGKAVAFTNANGETIRLTRDALGQVVCEHLPDGEELRFAFDPLGALTEAVSADITVRFERDVLGRIVRESQGEHWIASRYDAVGCLIATQTSTGHEARYHLDANSRPTEVNVGHTRLTFERDVNGREVGRHIGSGTHLDQRYDAIGRLVEQRLFAPEQNSRQPQTPTVRRTYSYGQTGCLAHVADGRWGTVDYVYDPAERLIGALRSRGTSERFEYDPANNLTRMEAEGERSRDDTLVYGPGNRLLRHGSTHYEYDAAGRRIRKVEDAESSAPRIWHYEWNAADRLKSVSLPDGTVWRYRYDALSRRVRKECLNRLSHTYLWNKSVIAQEIPDAAAPQTWLWDSSGFAALATIYNGELYVVINDSIGTPRELIDEQGEIVSSALLDSWGTLASGVAGRKPIDVPFDLRFPGQWADSESGLCYNFFRYYDGECGRYLSPDPIGLQGGLNTFAYVSNPTGWIDPFGLCPAAQSGTKPPDDASLYRRGPGDSKKLLESQAQGAEKVIGIHGVSTSLSPQAKEGQVVRSAKVKDIEAAGFNVTQTGNDPNHHTVELPKPVTPEVAKTFNDLFK